MRILNVTQTYFPYLEGGGMPVKVRAISRTLARHGHSVTVLTANLGSAPLTVPPLAGKMSSNRRVFQDDVEVIYLPTLTRYRTLTVNPHVIRFCRASLGRFDLVHCYGLYDVLGPSVSYFCRRRGLPCVVEPMGMYRPIDRSFQLKRMWHLILGRHFLRNASRVVATSELERQELLQGGILPERIVKRYNGIDTDMFSLLPQRGEFREKWGISSSEPVILFLSRLIPRKGADVLIQAFADACSGRGRLVIAGPEGETGYRTYLEKCARDSGVGERVIFTGPLYDGDKKSVFIDSDIFALPSRYENFANAPAEAVACGLPVILSPSCGIAPLIEGRAGLVVSPKRELLSAALSQMLGDESLYANLKQGCHQVASELSWDRLMHQMEATYASLLAQGNALH